MRMTIAASLSALVGLATSHPALAHCGECGVGEAKHAGEHHAHTEADKASAAVPADAKVFFVAPADGAKVTSPVAIKMGVEAMTVKPAGTLEAATGHHHIIVDGKGVAPGTAVPADATHIHYGKGQTETTLELAPGTHTLTLQFADGMHRSYGPALASTITITVTE